MEANSKLSSQTFATMRGLRESQVTRGIPKAMRHWSAIQKGPSVTDNIDANNSNGEGYECL